MSLVAGALIPLSGKALLFVLPAILMFMSTFTVILLLDSAVSS